MLQRRPWEGPWPATILDRHCLYSSTGTVCTAGVVLSMRCTLSMAPTRPLALYCKRAVPLLWSIQHRPGQSGCSMHLLLAACNCRWNHATKNVQPLPNRHHIAVVKLSRSDSINARQPASASAMPTQPEQYTCCRPSSSWPWRQRLQSLPSLSPLLGSELLLTALCGTSGPWQRRRQPTLSLSPLLGSELLLAALCGTSGPWQRRPQPTRSLSPLLRSELLLTALSGASGPCPRLTLSLSLSLGSELLFRAPSGTSGSWQQRQRPTRGPRLSWRGPHPWR